MFVYVYDHIERITRTRAIVEKLFYFDFESLVLLRVSYGKHHAEASSEEILKWNFF